MRLRRVIRRLPLLLSLAPPALLLLLWVASLFCSITVSFGIPPYGYDIQILRGTLQVERSFDAPQWQSLHCGVEAAQTFDRAFYDNWARASVDEEQRLGIYSATINYVLSDETTKLDPSLLVTPADLMAIPFSLLLAAACLPGLAYGAVFLFIRVCRKIRIHPALAAAALAVVAVVGLVWPAGEKPSAAVAALLKSSAAKEDQGDFAGAMADCNTALQLDPNCAEAYEARALAELNADDGGMNLDRSIADVQAADQINHRDGHWLASLYEQRCHDINRTPDEVLAYCNAVLTLDPRMPSAYATRGLARQKKGDFSGAIADFTRALELGPQYDSIFTARGAAKKTLGDLTGALADFDRAIAIGRNIGDAYTQRAEIKKARGDLAGAAADLVEAGAYDGIIY